jgi:urease accessory protein
MNVNLTQLHRSSNANTTILALTAEERTRSRQRYELAGGTIVSLQLPRGTLLQPGNMLTDDTGSIAVEIAAKAEPVLTVRADRDVDLLRAAYHLGNRHVALEVAPDYLRLSADSVLADMLVHLGLAVTFEELPFFPEGGAYSGERPHHHHHHHHGDS